MVLPGLLSFFNVKLGKALACIGKLNAVDNLLSGADGSCQNGQRIKNSLANGRCLVAEREKVQDHKEELVGKAERKQDVLFVENRQRVDSPTVNMQGPLRSPLLRMLLSTLPVQ